MSAASPDLILLKGAPGVGKSTAAKLLARHFPSGVRIEVDDLRRMVVDVKWTEQLEHRKVLTLGAHLAAGFLRSGFAPVILVDTFSGDKVDGFLTAFRSECEESRGFVAVLHASDEVLRDRVLNREADGFRDLTVSMRLNHEAVHDVRTFETLINTSDRSPTVVAQTILTAICVSSEG
jgi:predicted kinase